MKRALSSALLTISLLAAACGNPSAEEIAEASEGFGPVMEDVAVAAPTTTPTTTAANDIPDEIPFEDEAVVAGGGAGLQLPSSDVGICAALDGVLDLYFEAQDFQPLQDGLRSGGEIEALLLELDDGPFGAEWSGFWRAFVENLSLIHI